MSIHELSLEHENKSNELPSGPDTHNPESQPVTAVTVSAVMPCLNEEQTLAICIEKARRAFDAIGVIGEIVVADNGSTDRSISIAESLGARIVHESRKGYGSALMAGISAARGRYIVMADADDSYDWSELGRFVSKLAEGYDLVMGNRFLGGIAPGAMPPLHRYLGNPVLSALARFMYKIPIGDFHCGMRGFRRDAFEKIRPRTSGMEFATEMIVSAARCGLRITEIPTPLHPDKRNRPPHLRSFRDGWRHLRFILSHSPDYLYLWPGSLALGVGITLMLLLLSGPISIGKYYFGIHFMIAGSLASLVGVNVLTMGAMAKMILSYSSQIDQGLVRRLLNGRYTLETVLIVGFCLCVIGFGIDAAILFRWLNTDGPMEETIHLAILASTVFVMGLELLFTGFLLFLARTRLVDD